MDASSRESLLNGAFVALTDTLTANYDVVDLLHTLIVECTRIVDANTGGVMLADEHGQLQLIASTDEGAQLVELMQLAAGSGPCIDCFISGAPVSVLDIGSAGSPWPEFQDAALKQGFHSAYATPMKLRGKVIGTMNLFRESTKALDARDIAVARALADVATVSVLQQRTGSEAKVLAEQLQHALDSKRAIEQATGALAQSLNMTMDQALAAMRVYARGHKTNLPELARAIGSRAVWGQEIREG